MTNVAVSVVTWWWDGMEGASVVGVAPQGPVGRDLDRCTEDAEAPLEGNPSSRYRIGSPIRYLEGVLHLWQTTEQPGERWASASTLRRARRPRLCPDARSTSHIVSTSSPYLPGPWNRRTEGAMRVRAANDVFVDRP